MQDGIGGLSAKIAALTSKSEGGGSALATLNLSDLTGSLKGLDAALGKIDGMISSLETYTESAVKQCEADAEKEDATAAGVPTSSPSPSSSSRGVSKTVNQICETIEPPPPHLPARHVEKCAKRYADAVAQSAKFER